MSRVTKERLQSFRGTVIQIKGSGITKMFTIRKISDGIGVERIFPVYSPHIDRIEVNKVGVVRRARIYYLRELTGKKPVSKRRKEWWPNSPDSFSDTKDSIRRGTSRLVPRFVVPVPAGRIVVFGSRDRTLRQRRGRLI